MFLISTGSLLLLSECILQIICNFIDNLVNNYATQINIAMHLQLFNILTLVQRTDHTLDQNKEQLQQTNSSLLLTSYWNR